MEKSIKFFAANAALEAKKLALEEAHRNFTEAEKAQRQLLLTEAVALYGSLEVINSDTKICWDFRLKKLRWLLRKHGAITDEFLSYAGVLTFTDLSQRLESQEKSFLKMEIDQLVEEIRAKSSQEDVSSQWDKFVLHKGINQIDEKTLRELKKLARESRIFTAIEETQFIKAEMEKDSPDYIKVQEKIIKVVESMEEYNLSYDSLGMSLDQLMEICSMT